MIPAVFWAIQAGGTCVAAYALVQIYLHLTRGDR